MQKDVCCLIAGIWGNILAAYCCRFFSLLRNIVDGYSGANFYAPKYINTISKSLCIFDGIDSRAPATSDPSALKVVIEGLLLFRGV